MNKDVLLKIFGALGGRKFIVTVISTSLLAFVPNLSPEVVTAIAGIVASFILGQAYADGASSGATSTTTEKK